MKRQGKIERMKRDGYKVVIYMQGPGVEARKGLRKIYAKSITELHRKIYGW